MNRDEATLLAQDEEARRQAQIEFRRPLVLEAGAGTGKTTALVARILAWCLGAGWAAMAEELEKDVELRKGMWQQIDAMRASGWMPRFSALSADMTRTAAAPSLMPEALAAVTLPSRSKAGRSFCMAS